MIIIYAKTEEMCEDIRCENHLLHHECILLWEGRELGNGSQEVLKAYWSKVEDGSVKLIGISKENYYRKYVGHINTINKSIAPFVSYLEKLNEIYKKMKNCGNCLHREDCVYEYAWYVCEKWELHE